TVERADNTGNFGVTNQRGDILRADRGIVRAAGANIVLGIKYKLIARQEVLLVGLVHREVGAIFRRLTATFILAAHGQIGSDLNRDDRISGGTPTGTSATGREYAHQHNHT